MEDKCAIVFFIRYHECDANGEIFTENTHIELPQRLPISYGHKHAIIDVEPMYNENGRLIGYSLDPLKFKELLSDGR